MSTTILTNSFYELLKDMKEHPQTFHGIDRKKFLALFHNLDRALYFTYGRVGLIHDSILDQTKRVKYIKVPVGMTLDQWSSFNAAHLESRFEPDPYAVILPIKMTPVSEGQYVKEMRLALVAQPCNAPQVLVQIKLIKSDTWSSVHCNMRNVFEFVTFGR